MAEDLDVCEFSWSLLYKGLDVESSYEHRYNKNGSDDCGKVKSLPCEDVNIADLLPVDPFGMDLKSTVTSMKGWLQEIEEDLPPNFDEFQIISVEKACDPYGFGSVSVPDWYLKGSLRLHRQESLFTSASDDVDDFENHPPWNFGENCLNYNTDNKAVLGGEGTSEKESDGGPHDGFLLALNYLAVEDLVAVEGVCKSLRDAVRGDPLLWRNMKIKQPLSLKITDDVLVKLTNRAQGALESLSLIDCIKISNSGLRQVLLSNPKLSKLSVPGCIRLTVDGILKSLRLLNTKGNLKIKHLRIGGLGCVSEANFDELKCLLGAGKGVQLRPNKQQFFHLGPVYLSCDDNRPIDVEPCPICGRIGLVFDCPGGSGKCPDDSDEGGKCRGCSLCISRCIECGRCIRDRDYEETFLYDFVCLDCFRRLLSPEKPKVKAPASGQSFFRQEMRYQVCLLGD